MGTLPLARVALIALLATAACAPDDWRYHPFLDAALSDTPSTDVVDALDVAAADLPVTPDVGPVDAPDVAPVDASDVTPVDVIDAPPPDVPDVADVPAVDVIDAPPPDASPPTLRVLRGGITATGSLVSPALRVTGSLESVHRICTPDRSLCVTGGIAP